MSGFDNIITNIRSRLLFSFFGVIALLLIPTVSFITINFNIETQYKKTIGNMVLEYEITENTDSLVSLYTSLLQDINSQTLLSQYNNKSKEIDKIFLQLDKTIIFEKNKTIYTKIRNSLGFLKEYGSRGIENTQKKDFSQSSENLEQINRTEKSVKEDTAELVLTELSLAKEQQKKLDTLSKLSWLFGSLLFIAVTAGSIILAFVFSNRISSPLIRLSSLAKDFSQGNNEVSVPEELIKMKDEIGSLSNSFDSMIKKLREKISELERSNTELTKSKLEIEKRSAEINQKASELERMNKLMVGRELKMAELKKEIEELQAKLGNT